MSKEMMIEGFYGKMVVLGLHTPIRRAAAAAAFGGLLFYAARVPGRSFGEKGELLPWSVYSKDPYATPVPFLIVPLSIATAAYLFT